MINSELHHLTPARFFKVPLAPDLSAPRKRDRLAIASLIASSLSLVAGVVALSVTTPLIPFIISIGMAIAGIILAAKSMRRYGSNTLNVIGLIAGITVLGTLLVWALIVLDSSCFIFCP